MAASSPPCRPTTGSSTCSKATGRPRCARAHFIAGLSIVAIEQPNETRGVAIAMPARWDPEPALIDALVKGLTDNPLVAPVTLDQLFAHVPLEQTRNGPVVRELAPLVPAPPTVNPTTYRSTRTDLNVFATTVGTDDPSIAAGHRGLLISLTSVWPGAVGRRQSNARLAAINHGIAEFAALIQTPPSGLTVTLTSRQGQPSPQLQQPDRQTGGPPDQVPERQAGVRQGQHPGAPPRSGPGTRQPTFAVEARASGTFPLNVSVTTLDGRLPLRAARYTVRSTVFSGVGIFLTIGAGLFLAIWWVTHWRRSRRQPIRPATLAT